MSLSSQVITTYGESITVGGSSAKGFLSVINKSNSDTKTNMPVGVLQGERYRLITDALEPEVGDIIVYAGKKYEIMRVEQVRIFGEFSHNECILRRKGW